MFRPADLPASIADGTYELQSLLGKGGMAVVYGAKVDLERFDYAQVVSHHEAERGETRIERTQNRQARYQRWSRKPVSELREICDRYDLPIPRDGVAAVKVMMPHLEQAERFQAEWESLLAIGHPNLVQVYGGGHDEALDLHYYAMELLPSILPNKVVAQLPLAEKLSVIRQAALGLECLHGRGIIHRDVKPSNIVCTQLPDGRVIAKIADLGIAKDVNRTQALTMTDQLMGTPFYMAPEQAEGATKVVAASDVYALGATLYYLCSGKAPYSGDTLYEVLGRLARGERPTSIRELCQGRMPERLALLIEGMMAYDAKDRPPSMGHVVRAIDQLLTHLSISEELASARTVFELPPAPKISRDEREEFQQLLAVPAAPARRGRGVLVALVLLIGLGVGFALGPGRSQLAPLLAKLGVGSASSSAGASSASVSATPSSAASSTRSAGSSSADSSSASGSSSAGTSASADSSSAAVTPAQRQAFEQARQALARELEAGAGARFDARLAELAATPHAPSQDDALRRLQRARELAVAQDEAEAALADDDWLTACEALLRRWALGAKPGGERLARLLDHLAAEHGAAAAEALGALSQPGYDRAALALVPALAGSSQASEVPRAFAARAEALLPALIAADDPAAAATLLALAGRPLPPPLASARDKAAADARDAEALAAVYPGHPRLATLRSPLATHRLASPAGRLEALRAAKLDGGTLTLEPNDERALIAAHYDGVGAGRYRLVVSAQVHRPLLLEIATAGRRWRRWLTPQDSGSSLQLATIDHAGGALRVELVAPRGARLSFTNVTLQR